MEIKFAWKLFFSRPPDAGLCIPVNNNVCWAICWAVYACMFSHSFPDICITIIFVGAATCCSFYTHFSNWSHRKIVVLETQIFVFITSLFSLETRAGSFFEWGVENFRASVINQVHDVKSDYHKTRNKYGSLIESLRTQTHTRERNDSEVEIILLRKNWYKLCHLYKHIKHISWHMSRACDRGDGGAEPIKEAIDKISISITLPPLSHPWNPEA